MSTSRLENHGHHSLGGIILCGGKSTRMGSPKEWLDFGGEKMLQRLTRILSELLDPIVVVSAAGQSLPSLEPNVEIVKDEFDSQGPLSGIYSGLKKMYSSGIRRAFVTACDCPFIQADYIRFLCDQFEADTEIVMTTDGQRHQVLSAIYHTAIYSSAHQLIADHKLRPIGLIDLHKTKLIHLDDVRKVDPDLLSLENMNSPDQYQLALERFQRMEST